jgi:hypothetical protein
MHKYQKRQYLSTMAVEPRRKHLWMLISLLKKQQNASEHADTTREYSQKCTQARHALSTLSRLFEPKMASPTPYAGLQLQLLPAMCIVLPRLKEKSEPLNVQIQYF